MTNTEFMQDSDNCIDIQNCLYPVFALEDPDAIAQTAEAMLTMTANHSLPESQYKIGNLYSTGNSVPKNVTLAFGYYKMSAENGHLDAQYALAECFLDGMGTERDLHKAISLLSIASAKRHVPSLLKLASLYSTGSFVEKDDEKSFDLFLKASVLTDDVHEFIGALSPVMETREFIYGIRVLLCDPKSPKELLYGLDILERFSKSGNNEAQHILAQCYVYGWGVSPDFKMAHMWATEAVCNSNVAAKMEFSWLEDKLISEIVHSEDKLAPLRLMELNENGSHDFTLAVCFLFGIGVSQNKQTGKHFLDKAIASGNKEAALLKENEFASLEIQSDIELYNNGLAMFWSTDPKQKPAAFTLFGKSALHGHVNSQCLFGICHLDSIGVKRGCRKGREAVRWLTKAANEGHPVAELALARCYSRGRGVIKNEEMAQQLASRGLTHADFNDSIAQYFIGWCYDFGFGVKQDLREAFLWYKKSAVAGYWRGSFEVGWCYCHGRVTGRDMNKAIAWMKKSANLGYLPSQFKLADWFMCKEVGKSPLNKEEAKKWAKMAAERGHSLAEGLVEDFKNL